MHTASFMVPAEAVRVAMPPAVSSRTFDVSLNKNAQFDTYIVYAEKGLPYKKTLIKGRAAAMKKPEKHHSL